MNNRIRELRKSLDLSQKRFAEKIGLKQNAVSYMEKSGATVTEHVIKIRTKKLGTKTASAVQTTPNTAAVSNAYFKICTIRFPFPAPKFAESIGWDAWPML